MTLNNQLLYSLVEARAFLDGKAEVGFSPPLETDRYARQAETLRQSNYVPL